MFASIMTVGCILMHNLPYFLLYKEGIVGSTLYDPITSNFSPIDFNPYIFYVTMICIVVGMVTSIFTPRGLIVMTSSLAFVNIVRVTVLYFINLNAPADIIPLYDPFLECTFYKDVLITKDLFFSGHTSNIVLFAFLTKVKWMKGFFVTAALSVAVMLVLQHVHYTIDVVAAPFFAYGAYRLMDRLVNVIDKRYFAKH